jgi:hypothetical protein
MIILIYTMGVLKLQIFSHKNYTTIIFLELVINLMLIEPYVGFSCLLGTSLIWLIYKNI